MRILMLLTLALIGFSPALAQDTDDDIERLVPEVIAVYPHDTTAFTQGLLMHDGLLYESTGEYGRSTLRQVDPETGGVLQRINLPHYVFGEGLALVDDRLIQITWREQVALVYNLQGFIDGSLPGVPFYRYEGEGWGLCYDGEWLYMTDGSDTLFRRDPQTFELQEQILVTREGAPQGNLNELECVDGAIYANIFTTDEIMRIDPTDGRVTAVIDASGLLTPEEREALGADERGQVLRSLAFDSQAGVFRVLTEPLGSGAVLNGIAYNPETETFLLTGKRWPSMFEVRFVPG